MSLVKRASNIKAGKMDKKSRILPDIYSKINTKGELTSSCLSCSPGTYFIGTIWNYTCTKINPKISFNKIMLVIKYYTAIFLPKMIT